jgi:hypothetical protein
MATQNLGRIYFPIYRKTTGGAGRSVDDLIILALLLGYGMRLMGLLEFGIYRIHNAFI